MDYLWTPWRYRYVAGASKEQAGCIFCDLPAKNNDAVSLIVHRAKKNFIVLNRFPYTTAHSMIVPWAHVADLSACDAETLSEMMQLAQQLQRAIESVYHPEGFNLGMNLGRCAGAGIKDHLHLHVLPRWTGDTSFMTSVAETRLEPEDLATTYEKLRRGLEAG